MMYQEEIVLYGVGPQPFLPAGQTPVEAQGLRLRGGRCWWRRGLARKPEREPPGRRSLPLVFLGGRLVGGLDEIEALERSGDLERLVRGRV